MILEIQGSREGSRARRQQRYKLMILEIQGSREGSRATRQQSYKVIEGSSGAAVRSL